VQDQNSPTPDIGSSETQVSVTSPTPRLEVERQGAARYFLTPYVYPCHTRHGAVLLHLPRNKYYGLNMADVLYLKKVVRNWPGPEGDAFATSAPVAFEEGTMTCLIQSLLKADVLQPTPPSRGGIACSRVSLDGPLASVGDEIIQKASVRPTHFATFVFSLLSAASCLRCLPLKSTVGIVSRRKSRVTSNGYDFNLEHAAELVFVFRRLRPYFFVAEGNCLLHALTLVTFLAIHREFPCWVLGVRTEPWGAHSWVQHGDYLLDTNPEKVCEYEPILAI
jgi:Transglutaminase-like superfamily